MTDNRDVSESDTTIEDLTTHPTFLANLSIAAPCPANWDSMTGDDNKRFCSYCNQNVYNISAMSPTEAEALLSSQFGKRLCVRLFKRRDATLISRNLVSPPN